MRLTDVLTYDNLISLLDNTQARSNLSEAMKRDFSLFYYIAWVLFSKQAPTMPPILIEFQNYLQRLADGKGNNLAVNIFPGAGKTLMQTYWMGWCLIRNPNTQFLYVNSVSKAVKRDGTMLKNLLESDFIRQLFEITLDRNSRSNVLFRISGSMPRTGFVGVSIEGSITGLDAGNPNAGMPDFVSLDSKEAETAGGIDEYAPFSGGLICDDLLQSGDIRSETRKENMRDIYMHTLRSRLRGENSRQVITAQRLCVDDVFLTIKELELIAKEKWDWCVFPALDKDDKSVWEQRLPTKKLLAMKEAYSMREVFWAQYMQSPIVPSGEIIKKEWFRYYSIQELFYRKSLKRELFITADTAVGTKKGNDFTVFCVWLWLDDGLYLIDMIRGQWDLPTQVQKAKELWNKYRTNNILEIGVILTKMLIESATHGMGLMQFLKDERIIVQALEADKDKVSRIQEATPYIEGGFVFLPSERQDIIGPFLNECIAFTYDDSHKHDDIVDCLAYAVRGTLYKTRVKINGYPPFR